MISPFSRLAVFSMIAYSAMWPLAAAAQSGSAAHRTKVIETVENVKELYIAIMGEVVKPGTYHVEPGSLRLQSIVERAGGMTSDASMTVRVVRNGRVSHKEVFSPRANTPLFPGDLLIVDSRSSVAKFSSNVRLDHEAATIHASYEEPSSGDSVQIALMNLVSYPLVLKVRPEEANAAYIVEKMGQQIELLANTYVITPDTFPRSSSESAKRAVRLADGSVMVFDKGRVNKNRVPATLPKPIESDIAMGAQYGLIGSPTGQSSELRNLGQRIATAESEPVDFTSQMRQRLVPDAPSAEIGQPVNEHKQDSHQSISTSKPRIATIPFTGSPRIKTSSTREASSSGSSGEPIPEPDDTTETAASMSITEAPPLEQTDSPAPATFSNAQLSVLFITVGALIGLALVVRNILESKSNLASIQQIRTEQSAPVAAQPIIAPSPPKSILEQLINNELPLVLETVEFPSELALQGRIAPKPILRVDAAQSILKQSKPHFEAPQRPATTGTLREMLAQLDTAEPSTIRRPHFMSADQAKAAATTTASRERSESATAHVEERSTAPLAKALYQLEQGDVS